MKLTKDATIAKNTAKLQNVNKNKYKRLHELPSCIDDCKTWLRMLQKDYSIPSSKIAVFASKENHEKIVDYKLWDMKS